MNGKSWKTTLAGIATLLTALGALLNAVTGGDITLTLSLLTGSVIPAAIGLFSAKDSNVTGAGIASRTVSDKKQ